MARAASPDRKAGSATGIRSFEPPSAPRTPKSARTRTRLLETAATLFIERGYAAVSIRDIASAAELTNGAVYGHFRTKGQLLIEVIRWKYAERDAAIDFEAAAADPTHGVKLMHDASGRDLRVLQVDAASAARHDPDVAAGLAWLDNDRLQRTSNTMGATARDAEAASWLLATISAGIGMRESAGLSSPPDNRLRDVLLSSMQGLRERGTAATDMP